MTTVDGSPPARGRRVADIAWRYVGKGEFLAGTPARSLTAEEAAGREEEIEASGLYEKVVAEAYPSPQPSPARGEGDDGSKVLRWPGTGPKR